MTNNVELPNYETLLTEAIKNLAADSGIVSSPVNSGGNSLTDNDKNWAANVHKNRLVKIVRGSGAGQLGVIQGNSSNSLVIKGAWSIGLDTTSVYVIQNKDINQILRDVFGGGSDINASNPLEVHDPKVGSLISYEGTTDADGNPAGTTLECSGLAAEADFDGNIVIITSGDYAGQARDITGATNGGTVVPHIAFGGQIVSGAGFVIAALRLTPAEVAALAADVGDASSSTLGSILAILGDPAQSFLTMIGYEGATSLADKLTATRAGYLDELDFDLDARLGSPTGASLAADLLTIITAIQHGTYGLSAIETLVDDLETRLSAARAGYLDELDFDLDARLGSPAGASLAVDLATIDTVVDAIKAVTDNLPDSGALNELATIKALVDSGETDSSYSYTDAGGEQTVYEDTATTRRKISFAMDINAMTNGGVVKVYIKVDGTNYRVWIRDDVDSTTSGGTEDAYTFELTTNQNVKVTYEEDADEGADRSIPYSVVTEVKE